MVAMHTIHNQTNNILDRQIGIYLLKCNHQMLKIEVCMGVENPMGNGSSHTTHDGNGNSIYFTRVKIPKIIVMH